MPWGGLGGGLKEFLAVDENQLKQQLEQALATNRSLTESQVRLRAALESSERQLAAQIDNFKVELRKLEIERDAWCNRAKHEEQVVQQLSRKYGRKPVAPTPELGRLLRRLERNIAKEWRVAMEGRILQKRSEKHGKNEVRLCQVHDKELRWGHAPGPLGSSAKKLMLEEVVRIDYGLMSVAAREDGEAQATKTAGAFTNVGQSAVSLASVGKSALFNAAANVGLMQALPWLCFSLLTLERSYDFICPDEHAARCFVVVISRICEGVAVGGVRGRQQFESLKGWCKLKTWCKQEGTSVPKALLEAVRRVAAELPPPVPDAEQQDIHWPAEAESDGTQDVSSFLSGYPSPSSSQTMDLMEFCGESQPSRTGRSISGASVGSSTSVKIKPSLRSVPFRPPPGKTLPKEGQTWVFTGAVDSVDVFKDPDGTEQVNQMKCRAANQDRRMVTIVSAPAGHPMIEIRGTDKMKFVKGWIHLSDASGSWVVEQAPKAK
eukprot:TRINITY_DN20150_c0_g1_i1.p1 TRINITY_DN20150_c0_g1~~TRINITY_DN20150_c0_g1_i1.p1  ORF type:complete len:491 (-),score=116.34 TRINITY_DN20150_c0_g1_i1:46-1518(-)